MLKKQTFSSFQKNLRFLRKEKKLSQTALSETLGVTRSVIGAYEEGRAEPKMELLIKMADFFDFSLDDFVNKDLEKGESGNHSSSNKKLQVLAISLDSDGKENIELVPQKASAGYTVGYGNPEFLSDLPRFQLPMLAEGTYRAFEITGDSMLPLRSGAIIIGEYIQNASDITDGTPYVVVTREEGIVYKRIYLSKQSPSVLNLHSDNTAYPAYTIPREDIIELWKARGYISLEMPEHEMSLEKLSAMVMSLQKELIKLKS